MLKTPVSLCKFLVNVNARGKEAKCWMGGVRACTELQECREDRSKPIRVQVSHETACDFLRPACRKRKHKSESTLDALTHSCSLLLAGIHSNLSCQMPHGTNLGLLKP